MECYFYDEHGYKCDLSEIVSNTRVFFGRNQPFLCVEVDVPRQTFESREYWEGRIFDSNGDVVHMSDYNGTPAIIYSAAGNNGARAILYIDTYGGKYDYLEVTQQAQIDDFTYRFICYSKTYRLKSINLEAIVKAGNGGGEIVWYNSTPDGNPVPMSYRTDENPCDGAVTVVYGGDTYTQVWRADNPTVTGLDFPPLAESKGNPPNSSRSGRDLKCSLDEARFFIPIYSNPSIVPSDENYKLNTSYVQGMRYDTVYASVLIKYAFMISKGKKYYPYVNYEGKNRYVHAPAVLQDYDGVAGENVILSENDTRHFGFLSMDKDIEAIWGSPDAIFSWIAEVYGGYSSDDENVVIEDGRYFPQFLQASPSAPVILTSIWKTTATSQELQEASSTDSPFTGFVCFSAKTGAWEALEALGLYTSRYPYFGDKAYFTSFIANADNPEASKSVDISYSAMDVATVNVTDYNDQSRNLDLGDDLENDDQGVTYQVVAGLKYTCDSTSGGIPISLSDYDSDSRQNGISDNVLKWFDIEYTPPKIYGSQTRSKFYTNEFRAGAMGWNAMLRGYCSSTAITLSVYEAAVAPIEVTYDAVMESEDLDDNGLPLHPESDTWYVRNTPDRDDKNYRYINSAWVGTMPSVGDTTRVTSTYGTFYMTYENSGWENSTSFLNTGTDFKNASFAPNAVIETLNNHRANWTSYNIPVACVTYSWPSMLTSYFLSDSPFTDTESTIAELQESMAQAVKIEELSEAMNTTGNLDISITTKPLVSGQFTDNAYSGIKIQRDASKGVANIDGYSGGQRQVRFSSEGSVSCGTVIYQNASTLVNEEAGDSVIMDRSGFTTRLWVPNPTTADTFPFVRGTWVEQTHIGTDGFITAGAGYIRIGADGLSTFDDESVDECGNKLPVYNLSNEGLTYKGRPIIDSRTGMISMRTDSSFVEGNMSAVSITLPYVQIDDKGLRTFSKYYADIDTDGKVQGYLYDGDDLQCAVGTNGIIVAGAGAVKLDATGLTTWSGVRPIHTPGDPTTIDDAGFFDYSNAVKQCAVTVDGALIAGANLYKLDSAGLSYNFGQGGGLTDWRGILSYNALEDRVELYPDIYVESATVREISADKITTGTLGANVSIYAGSGSNRVTLGKISNGTNGLEGPGFILNQNGLNLTGGVVSLGSQTVVNSSGMSVYDGTTNNNLVLKVGLDGSDVMKIYNPRDSSLVSRFNTKGQLLMGNSTAGWSVYDNNGVQIYTPGPDPTTASPVRKPICMLNGTGVHFDVDRNSTYTNASVVNMSLGAVTDSASVAYASNIYLNKNARICAGPIRISNQTYYSTILSEDGLQTYSYDSGGTSTLQCSVDTEGKIIAGAGRVVLDSTGFSTYQFGVSSEVQRQCYVGVDGEMIAGEGSLRLGINGINFVNTNTLETTATLSPLGEFSMYKGTLSVGTNKEVSINEGGITAPEIDTTYIRAPSGRIDNIRANNIAVYPTSVTQTRLLSTLGVSGASLSVSNTGAGGEYTADYVYSGVNAISDTKVYAADLLSYFEVVPSAQQDPYSLYMDEMEWTTTTPPVPCQFNASIAFNSSSSISIGPLDGDSDLKLHFKFNDGKSKYVFLEGYPRGTFTIRYIDTAISSSVQTVTADIDMGVEQNYEISVCPLSAGVTHDVKIVSISFLISTYGARPLAVIPGLRRNLGAFCISSMYLEIPTSAGLVPVAQITDAGVLSSNSITTGTITNSGHISTNTLSVIGAATADNGCRIVSSASMEIGTSPLRYRYTITNVLYGTASISSTSTYCSFPTNNLPSGVGLFSVVGMVYDSAEKASGLAISSYTNSGFTLETNSSGGTFSYIAIFGITERIG